MTEGMIESTDERMGDDFAASAAGANPRKRTPPIGQRFVKGMSGNPAGRPPGRGATGTRGDRLPGADQPTRAMILEEAYRMVRVEEPDGSSVEIPAHRAVFRALTRAAMSGNPIAQRRWTTIVQAAEREQKDVQIALFNMLERGGVNERYCAEQRGFVPLWTSDDDIMIDGVSGVSVVRTETGEEDGA
ncbi:DUF5681 domain-containing protein [Sphingomonas alpina]|uniref:DUF5681 domain-containing protein n=1 Tax=Sphingomonas alpina TaxID=653931 RepID=A0A7H0LI44_9SPHN|nr:DUF5681 domain-containing protein [Sphingomonas alpina]QNQ09347.1 hypothetical protein H3Z74_22235 [Sphingomonas alpina]